MTKRARLTREEVLDHVLCDSDEENSDIEEPDMDDLHVPMADGSDDEFEDLDFGEDTVCRSAEHDSDDQGPDNDLPNDFSPNLSQEDAEPETSQLVKHLLTLHGIYMTHIYIHTIIAFRR